MACSGGFAPINAALRKLPAVCAYAFAPEHLVLLVEQDDADVWAKSVPVKHNQTPIFNLRFIMHGPLLSSSGPCPFLHYHALYYRLIAMKASQFLISTLKEAPADAEVVSH